MITNSAKPYFGMEVRITSHKGSDYSLRFDEVSIRTFTININICLVLLRLVNEAIYFGDFIMVSQGLLKSSNQLQIRNVAKEQDSPT